MRKRREKYVMYVSICQYSKAWRENETNMKETHEEIWNKREEKKETLSKMKRKNESWKRRRRNRNRKEIYQKMKNDMKKENICIGEAK